MTGVGDRCVTIVSGGTQGLGEAVARRLASTTNAALLLVGRSQLRGEALAESLTNDGTPAVFVCADVASPDVPTMVADRCVAEFGTVHALVNVAASTTRRTIFTDTVDHFDAMFAVNARAPYFLAQAVVRVMVADGIAGSIMNVGSVTGHGGQGKLTAYAMSKGALAVLTKNLAAGLMRHHIRVNQVNPGWMETETEHVTQTVHDGAPDDWLALAGAARPFGRLVQPWEVANLIAFCLSPDSGLLTGAVIDVDQSVLGGGEAAVPRLEDTVWPDAPR
jgi:NAD(P)-dependent dehydrogenase (short-subunit alcohol dehydrogenase family)